jgi:hypothetical protein
MEIVKRSVANLEMKNFTASGILPEAFSWPNFKISD